MEPIKVVLVEQTALFSQIVTNPFLVFLLGVAVTYVMTVYTYKLGTLGPKKDKVIFMKESVDELLELIDRVVILLDPNTRYPPDFVSEIGEIKDEFDYDRLLKKKISHDIDSYFDRVYSLKKSLRPLVAFYIEKPNARHLSGILEIVEILYREFVPQGFVFKRIYAPDVQSRVLHRVRSEYTTKARQVSDIILEAETGLFPVRTASKRLASQKLKPIRFQDFLEQAIGNSEDYENRKAANSNRVE